MQLRRHSACAPIAFALLVGAALLGSGCGVRMRMRAVEPVNVNAEGESVSVKVRIYQLKDAQRFVQADADLLWRDDRAVLGDDRLADPVTVLLRPVAPGAEPTAVDLALDDATRYIGVMALYPAVEGAPSGGRQRLALRRRRADDHIIELSGRTIAVAR